MGALITFQMASVLMGGFQLEQPRSVPPEVASLPNTKALGILLYTEYLHPLQVAAVLLLVAIIAAIALTLRERKDSKHVDAGDQGRVRAADRVRLVQMPASRPAQPPSAESEAAGSTPATGERT